MITITVNKQPWEDHDYTLTSSFIISEDATAPSAIDAIISALLLESYSPESIRNSLVAAAEELEDSINASYTVMQERL